MSGFEKLIIADESGLCKKAYTYIPKEKHVQLEIRIGGQSLANLKQVDGNSFQNRHINTLTRLDF